MTDRRLNADFFAADTLEMAQRLLGKVLVARMDGHVLSGVIHETEAYTEEDPACHTFGGRRSARTATMFQAAGHLYVYFIYGMYHCINVVTEREGRGCAVLIRGVIPLEGMDVMRKNRMAGNGKTVVKDHLLANGPGKVAQAFGFTTVHDGTDLLTSSYIYLEDRGYAAEDIRRSARIGIRKGTELDWRFYARIRGL